MSNENSKAWINKVSINCFLRISVSIITGVMVDGMSRRQSMLEEIRFRRRAERDRAPLQFKNEVLTSKHHV